MIRQKDSKDEPYLIVPWGFIKILIDLSSQSVNI